MADDNYDDEIPHDPMAGMANAMIILTGIMLLMGTFFMWQAAANLYQDGPLA